MRTIAITRRPSPLLERGERTHIGRDPIDFAKLADEHAANNGRPHSKEVNGR